MASEGEQATPTLPEDDPLREPFTHGWRRELVYRNEAGDDGRTRSDCYYFTPADKKLRSLREVQATLDKTNSGMSISCFSLQRRLLGIGPPDEIERRAGQSVQASVQTRTLQRCKRDRAKWLKNRRGADGLTKGERRLVEGAMGSVLKRSVQQKKRCGTASAQATAAAAAQMKRSVVAAGRAAVAGQGRTVRLVTKPQQRSAAPAGVVGGRAAQGNPIRVMGVQPQNGALSRGRGAPEGCSAGVGTKLLKILTKGQETTAVLTDYPKRRLKMMVKGNPSSPASAGVDTGTGAIQESATSAAALRRLVSTRPWRLAVVHPNGELDTVDEPRRRHRWRQDYQRQLWAQAADGTPQPLQIGRVRQYAACNLFCSRTKRTDPLELPSLRCVGCCCLSHPACVGLLSRPDRAQADFLCMDCFDRLRQRPNRRLAVQEPVRLADASPERSDSAEDSEVEEIGVSEVEEIVVVASEDESDALVAARAGSGGPRGGGSGAAHGWNRLKLVTLDDDTSSFSDAESVEEVEFSSLWSGLKRTPDAESKDVRAPPSLVRGAAGPPTLARGPPTLVMGPPSLARRPRPPPLQRAPAPTPRPDGRRRTVVVNRVPVSPAGTARAGPPVPPPAAVSSSSRGSEPARLRRSSGQGGCRVRVTGPPALAGTAGSPPASTATATPVRLPTTVVVVRSPTSITAPSLAPVRSLNPAVAPASTALTATDRSVTITTTASAQPTSTTAALVTVKPRRPTGGGSMGLPVRSVSREGAPAGTYGIHEVAPLSAADATRIVRVVGARAQREEPRSRNVGERTTGSTSRQASQVSRLPQAAPAAAAAPSAAAAPAAGKHVIKVTVKCKPQSNGRSTTVVVGRPATAPASSPSVVLPGSTNGLTEKAAGERTAPVCKAAEKKRPGRPTSSVAAKATVKTEPSFASDAGGRRVTRMRKRAAVTDTDGGSPVAKKRSWRAPDE